MTRTVRAWAAGGRAGRSERTLDSTVTDESDLATALGDFSYHLGLTDSAIAARGIRRLMRIGAVVRWIRARAARPSPDTGAPC